MYIDIGINLTNKQFAGEYDEVIDRAISAGVEQILLTGTSVRSSKEALALAKEYPETLFATAGIHPHDAKTMNAESIKILAALLKEKKVVAVGECGLDFDRDFSPRPVQESCFHAQLSLAEEVQKPLFLHERAAFDRFIAILKEHSSLPEGVVHCFTGQLKEAKTYLEIAALPPVKEATNKALELSPEESSKIKSIKLTNDSGSQLMTLTIRATDRELAVNYIQQYVKQYKKFTAEKFGRDDLEVVSEALGSSKPVYPILWKNMFISLIVFVFIAFNMIFFRYILSDTIDSSEDLEELTGVPTLGMIPEIEKKGRR